MGAQSCLVWGWKTSVWQDAKRCEMLICPHSRPSALSIDQPEPCQIMMQVAHLLVPSATWLSICGWVDSWVRIHPHTDLVDQHADQNLTVTTSSEHETPPKKIIKVLINVFFEYSICYRTLQIQDSKLVVLTLSTTEIQPGDEACASNKRSSITVPSNNGRLLNTQGETPSWTASCPTWHTSAWRKQTDVICLDWIILNINISLTSKDFWRHAEDIHPSLRQLFSRNDFTLWSQTDAWILGELEHHWIWNKVWEDCGQYLAERMSPRVLWKMMAQS